eukprot:scaffold3873_cov51-Phaeocystis_antarctica.AAC.2
MCVQALETKVTVSSVTSQVRLHEQGCCRGDGAAAAPCDGRNGNEEGGSSRDGGSGRHLGLQASQALVYYSAVPRVFDPIDDQSGDRGEFGRVGGAADARRHVAAAAAAAVVVVVVAVIAAVVTVVTVIFGTVAVAVAVAVADARRHAAGAWRHAAGGGGRSGVWRHAAGGGSRGDAQRGARHG